MHRCLRQQFHDGLFFLHEGVHPHLRLLLRQYLQRVLRHYMRQFLWHQMSDELHGRFTRHMYFMSWHLQEHLWNCMHEFLLGRMHKILQGNRQLA